MKALKYTKHFCFVFYFMQIQERKVRNGVYHPDLTLVVKSRQNHGLEPCNQGWIVRTFLKNDRFVLKTKKLFFSFSSSFRGRKVFLIFDDRQRSSLDKIHFQVGKPLDQKNPRKHLCNFSRKKNLIFLTQKNISFNCHKSQWEILF